MLAASRYFAIVFAAGFVLGMIRVPLLVPRFGERIAELAETPIMLAVVFFAARHVVRRYGTRITGFGWTIAGITALLLLLAAEIGLVLLLQDGSVSDYIAGRDPISGSVYLLALLLFAAMPWLQFRTGRHRHG